MSGQTPSQTVGPYFKIGLYSDVASFSRLYTGEMATPETAGRRIRLEGRVFDGKGAPINDCMIEVWQADADGRYRTGEQSFNDGFTGFGRVGTGESGDYVVDTVVPGQVPGPDGKVQAPHLNLIIFSRGILLHAYTRVYFEDQAAANEADPILALVPAERRHTLIAKAGKNGGDAAVYTLDIHMQGDEETVFFDV